MMTRGEKFALVAVIVLLLFVFACDVTITDGREAARIEAAEVSNTFYKMPVSVVENTEGVALMVSGDGNLWALEGVDFAEGEDLTLFMDDNATPNDVTDDVIVGVLF